MAYQNLFDRYLAYKVQSGLASAASGGSSQILRLAGGNSGDLKKAAIENPTVRQDGMSLRGRHGSRKTGGTDLSAVLALGEPDTIIEALMRDTWTSVLVITEATSGGPSEITTTTSTIVGNTGSWITAGLRVGDVIRLTNHATSANNNKNLLVTGLTATVITVAGTPLTLNAVADTAFTITRPKKVTQYTAGSLVRRYFTLEDRKVTIDESKVFQDAVFTGCKFSWNSGNEHVMFGPRWTGTGHLERLTGGSSPYFTSPSELTSLGLAVVDGSLLINGVATLDLTSLEIDVSIDANVPDMALTPYGPDVFTGSTMIGMNFGVLQQDLAYLAGLDAETSYSIHIVAVENESEPKDFFSIYIPNVTLGDVADVAFSKAAGAAISKITVPPALVGKDSTGGAYDATMIKFQTSAA